MPDNPWAAKPKSILSIDGVPLAEILSGQSLRDEFYEVSEFAEIVNRRVETIWRWWRSGEGPPYARIGSRRVIPTSGASEWLRARQITPPRSAAYNTPGNSSRARARESRGVGGSRRTSHETANPRKEQVHGS